MHVRTLMKKSGRSTPDDSSDRFRIEMLFRAKIQENNLYLGASLAYFFGVLYAALTNAVEGYFGVTLILTSIMIIWYLRDRRKEIISEFEKEIASL